MGRDSGKGDIRMPRTWERVTEYPAFREGHEKAFGKRDPFTNFCRKCKRTHSWCECSRAGNICKE